MDPLIAPAPVGAFARDDQEPLAHAGHGTSSVVPGQDDCIAQAQGVADDPFGKGSEDAVVSGAGDGTEAAGSAKPAHLGQAMDLQQFAPAGLLRAGEDGSER